MLEVGEMILGFPRRAPDDTAIRFYQNQRFFVSNQTQEGLCGSSGWQRRFPDELTTTFEFVTLQNAQRVNRTRQIGSLDNYYDPP